MASKKMTVVSLRVLAIVVCSLALTLSGCGGSDGATTTTTTITSTTTSKPSKPVQFVSQTLGGSWAGFSKKGDENLSLDSKTVMLLLDVENMVAKGTWAWGLENITIALVNVSSKRIYVEQLTPPSTAGGKPTMSCTFSKVPTMPSVSDIRSKIQTALQSEPPTMGSDGRKHIKVVVDLVSDMHATLSDLVLNTDLWNYNLFNSLTGAFEDTAGSHYSGVFTGTSSLPTVIAISDFDPSGRCTEVPWSKSVESLQGIVV